MKEFLASLGPAKNYIIYVGGFMILYLIAMIIYMRYKKSKMKNYIEAHPEAAKVFIKTHAQIVKAEGLYIHSVDGGKPETFIDGIKTGFYLLPGTHVIESTFTTSRPGVLHKTVTTSYGPSKQEVEVEARKSYNYSFNPDTNEYSFELKRD